MRDFALKGPTPSRRCDASSTRTIAPSAIDGDSDSTALSKTQGCPAWTRRASRARSVTVGSAGSTAAGDMGAQRSRRDLPARVASGTPRSVFSIALPQSRYALPMGPDANDDGGNAWPRSVALAFAVAWLSLRAPNLLLAPRVWAEEGRFLTAATQVGWLDSILFVYWRAGYFSWPPSVGATLGAHLLPLEFAPLASTLLAFALQISPVLAILFLRFDFRATPFQRAAAATTLLTATTTGQGIAWLNALNSQMHLGILTTVVLIASPRQGAGARNALIVAMLFLAGLSGAYPVFLWPVFVLAAIGEKDLWRWGQSTALGMAFVIQCGVALYKRFGLGIVHEKRGQGSLDFDSVVSGVRESVTLPMFGQRAVFGDHTVMNGLMVISLIALATAIVVLYRSASRIDGGPSRRVFGIATSMPFRLLWAWLATVGAIALVAFDGIPAGRYAVVPGAMTMAIVLLALQQCRSRPVRIFLGAVVAACIATGVSSPRHTEALSCDGRSSGWQAAAREWTRETPTRLPICPEGWTTLIYPPRASSRP